MLDMQVDRCMSLKRDEGLSTEEYKMIYQVTAYN